MSTTVLLVTPSEPTRDQVIALLGELEYTSEPVVVASVAQMRHELASGVIYDVALVDERVESGAGFDAAREIQAQLPELVPGQRFFATLQRTLPDGTFRALVAGQQMTLSLNSAAKSGDTLELEVSQVTPRAVFARIVGAETAAGNTASAQPALSQTGRLISFLLTGQPTPQAASLAGNQPLLNAPPTSATSLVPLLRQALGQSGLFYESHVAEWAEGKRPLASLLLEPQMQKAAPGETPRNQEP